MSIQTYFTRNFQQSSALITNTSAPINSSLLTVSSGVPAGGTAVIALPYIAANTTGIYVSVSQNGTTIATSGNPTLTFTDSTIPAMWQQYDNSPSCFWANNFTSGTIINGSATNPCNYNINILSSGS